MKGRGRDSASIGVIGVIVAFVVTTTTYNQSGFTRALEWFQQSTQYHRRGDQFTGGTVRVGTRTHTPTGGRHLDRVYHGQ